MEIYVKKKMIQRVSILCSFIIIIFLIFYIVPNDILTNYYLHYRIKNETNSLKKAVLINTSVPLAPKFWNRKYLEYCLDARDETSRALLANLIFERYSFSAPTELNDLLEKFKTTEEQKENIKIIKTIIEIKLKKLKADF